MPIIAFPTIGLLPLCLIGAAPLFAEGASVDWSAIYMRDVFAVEPFVGGLSVTIFPCSSPSRASGMDPVIDRFNPRWVAIIFLGVATIGLVAVATAPHPYIALAGFRSHGHRLLFGLSARHLGCGPTHGSARLGQRSSAWADYVRRVFRRAATARFRCRTLRYPLLIWAVVPVLVAALLVTKALAAAPMPDVSEPEPALPPG